MKLISKISERVGTQSVIVVLDIKKKLFGGYEIYTHNGKNNTSVDPFDFVSKAQNMELEKLL